MEFADQGVEVLDEQECLKLIEGPRIGRFAVCRGGVPAVLPVTFVVIGRDVYFLTGTGTKWDAALRGQSVAFEIDDIDVATESGWSVMVVGHAVTASPAARARAEALGLYPWAAGERHHLVRIRPDVVSGRRLPK